MGVFQVNAAVGLVFWMDRECAVMMSRARL